jgi:CheY-like chemotaxis protein
MGSVPLVLVVDDDEATRDVLRELLEAEGYRVDTARNGVEALARVMGSPRPDLAIVDLMMPEMDGWTLVSRLRHDPLSAQMPIIIVSAFGEPALMRAPAADAHLSKPLTRELLLDAVRGALTGASARSASRRRLQRSDTPIESTGPYPALHVAAENTAGDLAGLGTPEAHALRDELLAISAEVRRWTPSMPPPSEHRSRVTDELIAKVSAAFALLGRDGRDTTER